MTDATPISVPSILLLGLLLGMRHAVDADHVVAVTTIVARERRLWAAPLIGALWGLGHTVTILLFGGAIVLFGVAIPPRMGLGLEFAVALMLIALGAANLAGVAHRSVHTDVGDRAPRTAAPQGSSKTSARGALRPLVVGVVHGLAGSAAVALLVLATIRDPRWALLYLGVFGVGTVAGMMLLTTAFALPFAYAARRFDRVEVWLARATGLASVALGAFLAYEFVVARGLFSAAPHWTPG